MDSAFYAAGIFFFIFAAAMLGDMSTNVAKILRSIESSSVKETQD